MDDRTGTCDFGKRDWKPQSRDRLRDILYPRPMHSESVNGDTDFDAVIARASKAISDAFDRPKKGQRDG